MVIWGAAGAAPALADRSPANCGTNGLDLTISTDKTTVHNGDVVTYTVSIQNDKAGSCDISGATVTFALPGADGQPDRAHAQTLVPSAANPTQNYPAGTHEKLLGTFTYAVEVNPGVTTITPEGVAHGDLHISVNNGRADISKTLNSDVTNPKLTSTRSVRSPPGWRRRTSPIPTSFATTA